MEELHFGRAAARLHISQPPLSQAIRKLETELGVQLLRRNSRTVAPTAAGRVFAGEARRVLTAYEAAVAETRRAGGVTSTLRIGCVPYVPVSGLQRLIAAIVGRSPAVDVRVTHLLALEQVERLRAGELDVGIFCLAEEHPDTVVEPLFPGGEILAHLAYNHRLADREALTPKDLAEEEIVLFPRDANPAIFDGMLSWTDAAGYAFAGVREASGPYPRDLMLLVAAGESIALEPASFGEVGEAGALVVRRPIDPPLRMPDTVVAWRDNPPQHLRGVLDTVRDAARELFLEDSR
jgi:DNA-binding transcriptional LysR family regulator